MSQGYSLFDYFGEPKLNPEEVLPATTVTLRPYQHAAVEGVFSEWKEGAAATLVSLPTGCGKSVVFSEVMRKLCSGEQR